MKKILLAVNASPQSRRAAEYAAEILPGLTGVEVLVLSLTSEASQTSDSPELHGDVDVRDEIRASQGAVDEAAALLIQAGLPEAQIECRVIPVTSAVAEDIVELALAGGYDTVVLGRGEHTRLEEMFMGSVSSEVVHRAHQLTLWVIA